MKKLILPLLAFLLCSVSTYAGDSLAPLLDTVRLQLHSEQWVTTKSALVNVAVNAAVADKGIEGLQSALMQKLNLLSKEGEWHVLSFDRSQDKSGLESIQIMAQARLPQSALGNLRQKAKDMSKAGETYTIDSVQFTPSDDEIKQANADLRASIYQQAKTEIDMLNKQYTDQKYYLHQLDFVSFMRAEAMPMVQTMMFKTSGAVASNAGQPLNVGNKITLQATVVLASMPAVVSQKLTSKTNSN